MHHFEFKDKICLVTGGSRGIGKSLVEAFLSHNASVISISKTATQCLYDGNYFPWNCDLLDEEALEICLRQIILEVGLPDIIIHNVGGSCGVTSDFASSKDWIHVWKLNVGIAIDINKKLLPLIIKQNKQGKIIHISSSATKTYGGYAPYISAKAALNSYIKTMALRYSRNNILINGISPGAVRLPNRYFNNLQEKQPEELKEFLDAHVAIGRLAEPNEIANVALFLASPLASYMSGCIMDVDGCIS
jgi:NAD(P)-dependent dehydrogenase (short-subunit alcohol dehydrogenase family)